MKKYLELALFSLLYIVIGTLTVNNIFIPAENYFSLWLAGGFGFIMLVKYDKQSLPFLLVANILLQFSQFFHSETLVPTFTFFVTIFITSLIKVAQSLIVWWFWQMLESHLSRRLFKQGHDALLFLVIVAALPSLLTSWAYVLVNELSFNTTSELGLVSTIFRLSLADILGIFLFAPLIYTFKVLKQIKLREILILVSCYSVPFITAKIVDNNYLFVIVTPVAIVAAYYVDIRKLMPFHIAALVAVMWLSNNRLTVFSNELNDRGYVIFMLFAFIATLTIYFIANTFWELNEHKNNLELKVAKRTTELENEINERRKAVQELKHKDLLVNTILSSSPIGITLIKDRKIVWVSDGVTQILGFDPIDVIYKDTKQFYYEEEEYIRVGTEMYSKLEAEGFGTMDTVLCTEDGRPVDVLMQAKPLNPNSLSDGLIFTFVDITSLKNAQKDLEEYASKLEDINKELDAFAHSVAHDLKNPLNAVMGFSELLVEDYDLFSREDKINYLSRINLQADKMLQIIDTLLLLSGVRKENVDLEPCNMYDVVQKSVQSLEELSNRYNSLIHIDEFLPNIVSQAHWLEVVWVNLISNAIKYGGESPEIKIGFKESKLYYTFWVNDNGPGIPASKQNTLFMEFVRIKYDKNGHGLGLSIVKRIIERLDGKVFVKSEEGKGSQFGFKLPKVKASISLPVA